MIDNPMPFTAEEENFEADDSTSEETAQNGIENDQIPDEDEFEIGDSGTWFQFRLHQQEKAKQLLQKNGAGKGINARRSKSLLLKLSRDLKLFPVSGNVYQKKFGYGRVPVTLASSESEFNKFKNGLLKKLK